jgi:hypothetical protein
LPEILKGAACAYKTVSWGTSDYERFFFITNVNGACGLHMIPPTHEYRAVNIPQGTPVPDGTCAIGHTHPANQPKPSYGKDASAAKKGVHVRCNYVYSLNAIWLITGGNQRSQVASGTWWEPYKGVTAGDCAQYEPPPTPQRPKGPKHPKRP